MTRVFNEKQKRGRSEDSKRQWIAIKADPERHKLHNERNKGYRIRFKAKFTKEEWNKYHSSQRKKYRDKQPVLDRIYNQIKASATKRGLEFNLKKEDLFIPEFCPILGLKLVFNENKLGPDSYTADRVDNSKGYIKGNVQIISYKANMLKDALTPELCDTLKVYMLENWPGLSDIRSFKPLYC